jgi:hypothetical protein
MAEQPTGEMANTAATANLTDDLIVDILSRLPVKSLCRRPSPASSTTPEAAVAKYGDSAISVRQGSTP